MNSRVEIENKLKSIEAELREQFSVNKIALFGSYANNTNSPSSDIDLLVEFNKPIGWKFLTLNIMLENLFNRKVDLVTDYALRPELKNDIYSNLKYILN